MKNLKRCSGIFLASIMFMSNTVFAYDKETAFYDNINQAGYSITETIHYIVENYYYEDISTEELYEAAMKGIFSKLDKYSEFFSQEEMKEFENALGNYGVFLNVNIIEKNGRVFVDSMIEEDNLGETALMVDDEILKINGRSIFNMSRISIFNYIYNVKGSLKFEILRNNKTVNLVLEKKNIIARDVGAMDISQIAPYIKDDGSIKYVLLNTISPTTQSEFKKIIDDYKKAGVKKLIIDLRDNSGGTIDDAVKILQSLVSEGPVMRTVNSKGNKETFYSNIKEKPFEIAVLINNFTASAAEIIAIGLKEDGNITVGDKSFGKGVGQAIVMTGYNEASYKLTILEAFSGNATKIHGVGITPDYYVEAPNFIHSLDDIDIVNVKNILKHLGYAVGTMENNWDNKTVNSVKDFQTKKNLTATGVLYLETVLNLNYDLAKAFVKKDDALIKAYEVLKAK